VFENRVLRRILRPERDNMTGDWRKLHNEELHNFYSSPSIIRMIESRRMRLTEYVARTGIRGTQDIYGRPEGKRPLKRPRHRWVNNIKIDQIDLREVG
jgi:hypothetical protein